MIVGKPRRFRGRLWTDDQILVMTTTQWLLLKKVTAQVDRNAYLCADASIISGPAAVCKMWERLNPPVRNRAWNSGFVRLRPPVLYDESNPKTKSDSILLSDPGGTPGDKKPIPLQTEFSERNGAFSPDGKWIAYEADESG